MLWDLLSYCKIPPAVNEIEIHPLYTSNELVRYCLGNKILPVAYCPLARGANSKKTSNILVTDII
jgi:diketogulonate reductase-like aldo/keto reductase